MKRGLRIGLVVGAFVLLLGSCSAVLGFISPNQFTIAGSSYDSAKMYVLNYGQLENNNYYLDVWLVSDGIIVNTEGHGSGSGDEIGFFLISPTPTLGEGTFTVTSFEDYYGSVNTMYAGSVYLGANFSAGTSTAMYPFASGLLTVSRARVGDDYILNFEGTVEGGSTITAHYRGPLEGTVIDVPTGAPVPHL
ncbi:MAG: hypothetical protein KAU31_06025 [Spirochaetaceae bacterium]|nr:hypothetical protein [Spirochaetaceae bacterium]